MIKYKVSELVRQAKAKADLQNSSFITYAEDIHFLNDSWIDLWQKAINAGEKYWLKSVIVRDGEELPEDFHQLMKLYSRNGGQIERRSLSMSDKKRCYEIKNNKLYLYNVHDEVTMDYYPVPVTLLFPRQKERFSLSESFIAGHGKKVYSNTSVFDIESRETETFNDDDDFSLYQVFADFIVLYDSDSSTYKYIDIETLQPVVMGSGIPVALPSGELGLYNSASHTVTSADGTVYTLAVYPAIETDCMVMTDEETLVSVEGIYCYSDAEKVVYSNINGYIMCIKKDVSAVPYQLYDQRGILLEEDILEGTGIWFNNSLYTINEDMILNYPSNLFYSALSYKLAIYYKAKQNEDTSALDSLLNDAMNTYFDTISQDDFEPVRIRNAYY